MGQEFKYLRGFGNEFESEALPNALPKGCNNPQKAPYGLYAEQLSGSAFTAPAGDNQRSWLYRIMPSVKHDKYELNLHASLLKTAPHTTTQPTPPDQLRWDPIPYPEGDVTFAEGLTTFACNGDVHVRTGSAVHIYHATKNMERTCFYNADGDFLIVPQEGRLACQTEFGWLAAEPGEIIVIQRGIKFSVNLPDGKARGYVCENYGEHFTLPYRGPIGANGLANARDFLTPQAAFVDDDKPWLMHAKFLGNMWQAQLHGCPFDVVAWHGNYAPYKYDLRLFNTINTVSYDHPDPSIFTVLTSPTNRPGTANIDFAIFPPRWMVAEETFRPPYFHRNVMSEYMGLIYGVYDAKPAGGFEPGGGSLHNCMTAHGPEADAVEAAEKEALKPVYQKDTLAFMFESSLVYQPTAYALQTPALQGDYLACWRGIKKTFKR